MFCLLVFINYANAEDYLIEIDELLQGDLWTNFQDDKKYSLKIPNRDKDNNAVTGITMKDTCFIKENENIIILYDNAYTSGGGGGGGIDSSGTVSSGSATKTVKTILTIQNINKIENEKIYTNKEEILLKVTKDDCYIIKIWENDEGSNSPDKVLHTKILIGVNEICETGNGCNICDYNGSIFYYTGRFENGDTHNSLEYKLNVLSNKVCAKKSNSENPEWYVKKGSDLTINYTEGSYYIPYSNESQKTVIFINEKSVNVNKLPKKVDEDMKIELCIVPQNSGNNNSLYKDKISAVGINIKVDDTPPKNLKINPKEGSIINTWTNRDVILEVSGEDDISGIAYYEYKVGEQGEWTRGNTYETNVDEGIFEETIKFRAVDNVGHESEEVSVLVKIDKRRPVVDPDNEKEKWTKDNITLTATDEGSGFKEFGKPNGENQYVSLSSNVLNEEGIHTIIAVDNVGNWSIPAEYWIDKTPPEINLSRQLIDDYYSNSDVTIEASDQLSGIQSIKLNEQEINNSYVIDGNGEYTIECFDKASNAICKKIYIDKILPKVEKIPEITIPVNGNLNYYREENGTKYLNAYDVNYTVTEENSGIKSNLLYCKYMNSEQEVKILESKEKEITYTENIKNLKRDEKDETLKYIVRVTDKAGNESVPVTKTLVIPRKIILKPVESDNVSQGIRKSYIKDGYTINGILINKIDFDLYKEIRLKKIFLGDKPEGQSRKEFGYEEYKSRFGSGVSEQTIRKNWEEASQSVISKKDVKDVSIGGVSYWYYEDKTETKSGLGHRGIRYQAEWDWELVNVPEKGEYIIVDKTANNPGSVKIRIQGTDENGQGIRYVVLDSEGNKIEDESDPDFTVPVNGVIRLAVKIEDEDFDDYNIETTELVKAEFTDDNGIREDGFITVAMTGAVTDGYIEKAIEGGRIKSEFKAASGKTDGWYEFENPEVKLYYNKSCNIKITMTEGCKGKSGAYKDVTESVIIRLKAGNPSLGGFKLLVGNDADYNNDGISAQPHQKIELGIEMDEDGPDTYEAVWNYGDGDQDEGEHVTHKYNQSPERTGNTSEYTLTITVVNGQNEKSALVNVYIIDTQYGTLLGDEEWIGVHPVLGKIQVPENVTLKVKDNKEENNNPTLILGYGSELEERKGFIEVLNKGKLSIETENVKLTEGKNGIEFTEVKTDKEREEGESLKWGGIVLRSGAITSDIKNAEIKYAVTGISVEKGSVLKVENIQINNCSQYGLKTDGEVTTENCEIEGAERGLCVKKEGSLTVKKDLKILNIETGIECDGSLKAGSIEIKEASQKGITVKGRIEVQDRITIQGDGIIGIENEDDSEIKCGEDISVKGFEKGIKNSGIIKVQREIKVTDSNDYGIKNEGSITAESLNIKALKGRGYVCGSGSTTKIDLTKIEAEEIGIHCTGTAEAEFGKSEVRALTYGIKTDRDEKGKPAVKFDKESIIEGASVLWYDWENGVLIDEEIKAKTGE